MACSGHASTHNPQPRQENRKVLLLFERNHGAMHERVDQIFGDEAIPLDDRIRMAGSLGVLLSVFGGAFANVPVGELRPAVDAAVAAVLRPPTPPKRSRRVTP